MPLDLPSLGFKGHFEAKAEQRGFGELGVVVHAFDPALWRQRQAFPEIEFQTVRGTQ